MVASAVSMRDSENWVICRKAFVDVVDGTTAAPMGLHVGTWPDHARIPTEEPLIELRLPIHVMVV